jgi:hypothetical protein
VIARGQTSGSLATTFASISATMQATSTKSSKANEEQKSQRAVERRRQVPLDSELRND